MVMRMSLRFIPGAVLNAKANLTRFVELVHNELPPLIERNRFEENAWSIEGLGQKGGAAKFVYFSQEGVHPRNHYPKGQRAKDGSAEIPIELLMREPFRQFAKAMVSYLHGWEKTTSIPTRVAALRHLEAALYELNNCTCPTGVTPEIMERACDIALTKVSRQTAYDRGMQLRLIYRYMVTLGLVAIPSEWTPRLRPPQFVRNRVGKKFDEERRKRMPSPLVLEALADIFNSDSNDVREIFVSSACALMVCTPDRSSEFLFAPWDIVGSDWEDTDSGEVGVLLRWFPAKGGAPMLKTVIPSMRDIALRAVDRIKKLSAPARQLALWYEHHPDDIFLPPHLETLRGSERLDLNEVHAIIFGGEKDKITLNQRHRALKWLKAKRVPRLSKRGGPGQGTTVAFADLERSVLAQLPQNFPIMDLKTGMRYSEALCLARLGEFDSQAPTPVQCCFDRIKYPILQGALQSHGTVKSVFEQCGYKEKDGSFLFMTTHMLRHYLNTLVRQPGTLAEEEIAMWSGRKNINHNATYNHESDRDVIARLREAVGDPSRAVGPFANIDSRIFIRRDEFASIKVVTAHTTEIGYCVHDYAQMPCQIHQDCINCDELVCIKGDLRAERNLRKMEAELTQLHSEARAALSEDEIGSAEWFAYQLKTLERVKQLIAVLDAPGVEEGAVIQLSGVVPPSRIAMVNEGRYCQINPASQTITSLDDVLNMLANTSNQMTVPINAH